MLSQKNIFITILFSFQIISAQDKVRGVVQDEQTKDPIIGVNILLIGSETGTVTDINGCQASATITIGTGTDIKAGFSF